MEISERKVLLVVFDVFAIVFGLYFTDNFFTFSYFEISGIVGFGRLLLLLLYYFLFGAIFQLYNLRVSSNGFLVVRSIFVTAFVTTFLYVFSPYISPELPENRIQIVYLFSAIVLPVVLWRFIYIWILFSPKYFKTVVIIAPSSKAKRIVELYDPKSHHNIIGYVSDNKIDGIDGFFNINEVNLLELVPKRFINEIVFFADGFKENELNKINKELVVLFEEGVEIKNFEAYYEEIKNRIPKEYLSHEFYNQIKFSKNNENQFYLFVHRIIDVVISIFGLLILGCFLPLIIFGNLLGNRGPLFYSQSRVGKKGRLFTIYKLRSMVQNAETNGAMYTQKNDKRITSFGRFLRTTRLDEAPQFYNIIKGDMSLIGPRPERPEFVSKLEEEIPFYLTRHNIRPGLTGWAQVNYPYANTVEEQEKKLCYDLYYIKERSSFLDFKILIKTISTVLLLRGQ